MFLSFVVISLIISFVLECDGNLHHHLDQNLVDGLMLIDSVIQPKNCTGLEYVVVTMGINGGFAAQFQFAAAEWMRAFAAVNYSKPVIIQGPINGYSAGSQCAHVNHDWTCYFQPMSTCEAELLKTGKRVDCPSYGYDDNAHVPPAMKHLGLAFWWGVIQHKMFRFQPHLEEHINAEARNMQGGRGFPFGLPVVGMHVRHGDKHVDGFTEHSLSEELRTVRKSPDCHVANDNGDCFTVLNLTNHRTLNHVLKAIEKEQTIVIRQSDINKFNASANNSHMALPKRLFPKANGNHVHVNLSSAFNETLVMPLHIFVASDDIEVLRDAARFGFMYDDSGVSQTTGNTGMLSILLQNPEMGFNATIEIVSDIYFLSQSTTFLGVCGSQVSRMSMALSTVSGRLKHAVAMDWDQVRRVKQLSNKYHVPFPEDFSAP